MSRMTGRVIAGRYNLQHPIGRGAMGVVWRARDELLERDVAVKEVVIPAWIGAEERRNAYQRTLREARTAARLSHRGVVAVYDVVEEDGRPWIIMELVPSQSLDQILTVDGRLPPLRTARIGRQLLSALAHAHSAGVLHRDVKPSNVLIATDQTGDGWDERAVLTDFGIAQFEGDPRLTQTGMVMGSPGFTAPERIRGGEASPASDLWSLGATLYAAVEGRGPYERRGGAITTMSAIINEDAPAALHAGRLAPLIGALMRREPRERPSASATAVMFAEILPLLASGRATPRVTSRLPVTQSPQVPPPAGAPEQVPAAEPVPTTPDNPEPALAKAADAGGACADAGDTSTDVDASDSTDAEGNGAASDAAGAEDASADGDATACLTVAVEGAAADVAGAAGAEADEAEADGAEAGRAEADRAEADRAEADGADGNGTVAAEADGSCAAADAVEADGDELEAAEDGGATETGTTETGAGATSIDRIPLPTPRPIPTFTAARPGQRSMPPFATARPAAPEAQPRSGWAPPDGNALGWAGQPRPGGTTPLPAGGASYPRPSQAHPGRRWLVALVAGIIVLAAAIGAGTAYALGHHSDSHLSNASNATVTYPKGFVPAPAVVAFDHPSRALPAGWRTYKVTAEQLGTTAGFSIDLPPGWTEQPRGSDKYATDFSGPGYEFLDIDLTKHTYSNMLTEARYIERRAAPGFPGYQRLRLDREPVRGTAGAFWKFSYYSAAGVKLQANDILFIEPTPAGAQSYAILFHTSEAVWNATVPLMERILRTFRTVPPSN